MAKVPERGLTDQLPDNVRKLMDALNTQHIKTVGDKLPGGKIPERVLRLAVMGGVQVMPGSDKGGGGDVILSTGAHREFTVYGPGELRLENLISKLVEKATQKHTVEVYMIVSHADAHRSSIRELMVQLQEEVRAGRQGSLRGIHVRLFDRFGEDLWEGRLH
jgi:hypothetical protein